MNKLFTQQTLAKRWEVDVSTIKNWRQDGIIQQAKGIPAIRFTEQHILELEGVKLDKLSPLERRRLEREVEELERENKQMRRIIARITAEATQIYQDLELEHESS